MTRQMAQVLPFIYNDPNLEEEELNYYHPEFASRKQCNLNVAMWNCFELW